jgi:CheY-like chemotaxis protein
VVAVAASGEQALVDINTHRPDLVLMDIVLQGDLSGIDTAEIIRQQEHLPVIYLTAHSDPVTLERAKISEPYGYVLKPFDERELHSIIEITLYKHQAEKRLHHINGILRAIRNVNQLIVQEKDRDRLIDQACRLLTEGRGYFNAYIALVTEGGQVMAAAAAGADIDASGLPTSCSRVRCPSVCAGPGSSRPCWPLRTTWRNARLAPCFTTETGRRW